MALKKISCFLLAVLILMGLSWRGDAAQKEVHCPTEISLQDLKRLAKRKKLSFQEIRFQLDGSSRALLKKVSKESEQTYPLAYERLEARKIVCWYKTSSGYIGLRQR